MPINGHYYALFRQGFLPLLQTNKELLEDKSAIKPGLSGKILIVDDDEFIRLSLKMFLEQHFETVHTLEFPAEIPSLLGKVTFDILLLDMNFSHGEQSGEEGIQWLKQIRNQEPSAHVIVMTAYGDVSIAVEAIKNGAADFIVKPWQNDKLLTTVKNIFELSQERKKVKQLRSSNAFISSGIDHSYTTIIGQSTEIREIFRLINKVAKTTADVLILGENGTGKELAARAIHRNSLRADQVFLPVDLATISETIFESELFGHKKGAFTDAQDNRIGRVQAASGGTLFFDEIGNLSLPMQSKLLSILQNRTITPVGSNEIIPVDVRIICATNTNLAEAVSQGTFREDLLYRINTVEIRLPSIRERRDDISLLAEHFIELYSRKYQKQGMEIPPDVMDLLENYHWPGNVRELQHAMERAVILSENSILTPSDFSFLRSSSDYSPAVQSYNLNEIEKWAVIGAIKKHQGNISHAAAELGLSRGAMYRRMHKYGL